MMLRSLLFSSLILFLYNYSSAQQKQLDHSDFALWKTIRSETISNDGAYVAYVEKPGEGDSHLKIYEVSTGKTLTFERANNPIFSPDNEHLIFTVKPASESVKNLRRSKVDKSKLPTDTLAILNLNQRKVDKISNLKKHWVPEEIENYLVYQVTNAVVEADTSEKKSTHKKGKKWSDKNGFPLVIRNLKTSIEDTIPFVKHLAMAKKASQIIMHSTGRDSTFDKGIYNYDFQNKSLNLIAGQKGEYKKFAISEDGQKMAFVADVDTSKSRIRPNQLRYYDRQLTMDSAVDLNSKYSFLKDGWTVSENMTPYFSTDNNRLFFGTAPDPELQDTSLLKEEIVDVEVWHYKDPLLYTQQNVRMEDEKKRTYTMCYTPKNNKVTSLSDLTLPEMNHDQDGKSPYVVLYDARPYQQEITWVGRSARDVYIKNIDSGKKQLIGKGQHGFPRISDGFEYVYWYNPVDTTYYTYEISTATTRDVSKEIKQYIYDEINDRPTEPNAYGVVGWLDGDEGMLVNDRYDTWQLDPRGKKKPIKWTNGRPSKTSYRYISLDPDERTIDPKANMLFYTFNENKKSSGYALYRQGQLTELIDGDWRYDRRPNKAKNNDLVVFTKEDFKTFPDLYFTSDYFKTSKRISDANPQQKEYAWGSIEYVEWTGPNGQKMTGQLVYPGNFDVSKKYPMIVNFYERSSNGLHGHRTPAPHRSTINYSFYASRGYLIFNPDVHYKIGYPGESAYDAVVSGTKAMIEKGFVDAAKVGIQGHSWGGYQIAHIITKTDMFACAESGAPVVNMISAYGGIRWGSGMSRMFQYERTQSRIGGTLWETPELYIENSPIFNADKINTPVLILHNDNDGAVPWYQGIEFFTAMRRLDKPAWMLNYKTEPHWPLKLQNRKDFNVRMQQFFDHYLMDGPLPEWMEKGVPAVVRGIRSGY